MPLNPADLLVGQISQDDILEFIEEPVSPRTDTFTVGSADLDMDFRVPGDKLKPAIQWFLGVDYVDQNNALRRSLPMFHPVHNWAWAKQITVNGQMYNKDDLASVVWDFQITPAAWKQYRVKVGFDIPPFKMLEDDVITSELQRFTFKKTTPDTKLVTVENGQVLYTAPGYLFDQKPMNLSVPVARRDGAGYKVIWYRVPAEFVQPDDDTAPIKFMQAKGKTNATTIFGCPPETLQLVDVNMDDKYVCPILTDQMGSLQFLYRIEFDFLFIKQLDSQIGIQGPAPVNPPPGQWFSGAPVDPRRGWNVHLGPFLKYWPAVNAVTGEKIFPPVELNKLFTIWSDPIS